MHSSPEPAAHSFETLVTRDMCLAPDVVLEAVAGGVLLRSAAAGDEVFIPTSKPASPGGKIFAVTDIACFAGSAFVGETRLGGGGLNAALALADLQRKQGAGGDILLLNTGPASPELARLLSDRGIVHRSLARQTAPLSIIGSFGADRLIVKGPAGGAPGPLAAKDAVAIAGLVRGRARAVSVSSKDAPAAGAHLAAAAPSCRVVQPTGSLGQDETFALLADSDAVISNYDELCRLGAWLGVLESSVDGGDRDAATEGSPGATRRALEVLRALWDRGLAGRSVTVTTLGRHGSIVADWRHGEVHRVDLRPARGRSLPATPSGAGDAFLAHWLAHRASAASAGAGHERELDVVLRATEDLAVLFGMRPGELEIWSTDIARDFPGGVPAPPSARLVGLRRGA